VCPLRYLTASLSVALGCLAAILFSATSFAGTYAVSAHGNTGYGVKRTAGSVPLPDNYVTGNCAHCHEQHASIDGTEPDPAAGAAGFLLLADGFDMARTTNPYTQPNSACFYCHTTTLSLQSGGITNKDYSATFGGATATTNGIMQAFNQASYHNLYDVSRYITGASGTKTFTSFPTGTNPCSGCHNVHMAKANKQSPGDPTYTAISRPSDHDNLWGDDTPSERMTSATYGTGYQPPNHSVSNLEPDGASSIKATQAAKTPDYNTFCIDCHNSTNAIPSTTLSDNLKTFNWNLEVHGAGAAEDWTNRTEMRSPYSDTNLGSYVLSCLDCHEPHGAANAYLIRNSVNAEAVSVPVDSTGDWGNLCNRCHNGSDLARFHHRVKNSFDCTDCHLASGDFQDCTYCHYHGSSAGGYKTF